MHLVTGKSEALLFAELGENMLCKTICFHMYCWLVDAKIQASDKDLPAMAYPNFAGIEKRTETKNTQSTLSYPTEI